MRSLLLLFLLLPSALGGEGSYTDLSSDEDGYDLRGEWERWVEEHGRDYGEGGEGVERFAVWAGHREYIHQHNKNAHLFGYKLKMNHLGDLVSL